MTWENQRPGEENLALFLHLKPFLGPSTAKAAMRKLAPAEAEGNQSRRLFLLCHGPNSPNWSKILSKFITGLGLQLGENYLLSYLIALLNRT